MMAVYLIIIIPAFICFTLGVLYSHNKRFKELEKDVLNLMYPNKPKCPGECKNDNCPDTSICKKLCPGKEHCGLYSIKNDNKKYGDYISGLIDKVDNSENYCPECGYHFDYCRECGGVMKNKYCFHCNYGYYECPNCEKVFHEFANLLSDCPPSAEPDTDLNKDMPF